MAAITGKQAALDQGERAMKGEMRPWSGRDHLDFRQLSIEMPTRMIAQIMPYAVETCKFAMTDIKAGSGWKEDAWPRWGENTQPR
jgi:hypothetical protein